MFLKWNRRLLSKYRHANWHFCWFYFNMDKPAAPKNRLNIHCSLIHQIDIAPALILSSRSMISSKALAEMVLLSNNSIWDMSCFLRSKVVQLIGQISINWRVSLLSIIIIRRGQQRLTPLGWLTTWWRHSIWSRATKRGKIKSRMHKSWWKSKVLYHEMASSLPYKA